MRGGRRKPGMGISENKEYKQKIILPLLLIDKTLLPMYKFPQYLRILARRGWAGRICRQAARGGTADFPAQRIPNPQLKEDSLTRHGKHKDYSFPELLAARLGRRGRPAGSDGRGLRRIDAADHCPGSGTAHRHPGRAGRRPGFDRHPAV